MSHKYNLLPVNQEDIEKFDDEFLKNIYLYYVGKGRDAIIADDVTSVLISTFVLMFLNFLYTCINFHGLFTNQGHDSISNYIHIHKFWHMDAFMIICFIVFGFYITFRIFKTISDIKKYKTIKKFYNDVLKIKDSEIVSYRFDDIIKRIIESCYNTSNINIYTATTRIMKLDNIMISLFDNKVFNFGYLSNMLEWNIKFCLIYPLQNNKLDSINNIEKYIETIKTRIIAVSICNFIGTPFILLFSLFYACVTYGESLYNSFNLIASRKWTNRSQWRFRFYNELPHLFEIRMAQASFNMQIYMDQFNYPILEIFSRLVVFVCGSLLMFLVFIVFVNENNLTNKGFFGYQQVVGYIAILATILSIFRNYAKHNHLANPKKYLLKANESLKILPNSLIERAKTFHVLSKLSNYYQYSIVCVIKELIYIILTPIYYMPLLYTNADTIAKFILDSMENNYNMGVISKYSNFDNYCNDVIVKNPKLEYSAHQFNIDHPEYTFKYTNNMNDTIANQRDDMDLPQNSLIELSPIDTVYTSDEDNPQIF